MALNYPSYDDLAARIRADVQTALPDLDPTIQQTFQRALTDSLAARIFEVYNLVSQVQDQLFPQTASDEFLERWAEYEDLSRNPATSSSGNMVATGTVSTVVPIGTLLNSLGGVILETQASVTIEEFSTSISSISFVGSRVTVTTASNHNLASGVVATIADVDPTDYNGDYEVTVLDEVTFEYSLTSTPAAYSSGGTASFDGAIMDVESQGIGLDQNLESGATATFSSTISGLDPQAYTGVNGIQGGTDIETDAALLVRILESRAGFDALFNDDQIIKIAKTISGVTRVFVLDATPAAGQVSIYFMRDDDPNPIPGTSEVEDVKDAILTIKPANTADDDVIVAGPTPITVDFEISSIVPDTTNMRSSISQILAEFFTDELTLGEDITLQRLNSVLFNGQDSETGVSLISFDLDGPASDVVVGADEIGVLGDIVIT